MRFVPHRILPRAMWQLVKHTYGTEFVMFLDKQIEGSPPHARGSFQKQWRALIETSAPDVPDTETSQPA